MSTYQPGELDLRWLVARLREAVLDPSGDTAVLVREIGERWGGEFRDAVLALLAAEVEAHQAVARAAAARDEAVAATDAAVTMLLCDLGAQEEP